MPTVNRESYAEAHRLIACGQWSVDALAGTISNRVGQTLGARYSGGYLCARVKVGDRRRQVACHRVIWEHVHGPIPDGLEINHINAVKSDNRIANLEVVTTAENTRHARRLGLQPPTPRGVDNPCSKLTPEQVLAIFDRVWTTTDPIPSIADDFHISQEAVRSIRTGRLWGWLVKPIIEERGYNPKGRRPCVYVNRWGTVVSYP